MNPFLRIWIAEQEDELNKLAHILANGKGYDEYLIGVGKYRARKGDLEKLKERLKKSEVADDEVPDEDEPPAPTNRERVRKKRPNFRPTRSWGGQ